MRKPCSEITLLFFFCMLLPHHTIFVFLRWWWTQLLLSQLIAHHEKVLILFIILCNYNKQECCVLLCRRRVWNRNIRKVAQQTFRRIEARIGIGIVRNGMTEEITRWKITCQFDRQPNSMSYTFNLSRWNDRGEGGVLCGVFDVWCVLAMCPTSSHSSVVERERDRLLPIVNHWADDMKVILM